MGSGRDRLRPHAACRERRGGDSPPFGRHPKCAVVIGAGAQNGEENLGGNPPANPWLERISQRNAKVPTGVRVVRFDEDDGDAPLDQPLPPRSELAHASTRQAA